MFARRNRAEGKWEDGPHDAGRLALPLSGGNTSQMTVQFHKVCYAICYNIPHQLARSTQFDKISAHYCAIGIGTQEIDVLGRSRGASKTEFISLAFRVPRVAIR